jgi:hypothetical protein
MKTRSSVYWTVLISRLRKATSFTEDLFLSLRRVLSRLVTQKISRVKEWFGKNKQILAVIILVIALIYFIPYTFMLGNREKTIVGIILQILAGAILIFDQISSNARIRKQVTRIIQTPPLFALLVTIIFFPFMISILTVLNAVPPDKWLAALGISAFTIIAYGMFLISLTLLRRIKWLRRKDYVPSAKDKLDISDLSLRNVGILFGVSVLIMILLVLSLHWFGPHRALWIQMLWGLLFLSYGFTLFPLLIISPLYCLAFVFAKLATYIRTKKSLEVWFWIFLFVLWAWGGLLLLLKEFT